MSNQTGFRQGRLGIGKNPIFPLDISGSTRIEGDLILGGTIADINGTPIEFGASSATLNVGTNMPIPEMTVSQVPSWEDSVTVEGAGKFVDAATAGDIYYNGGKVGIGTSDPDSKLHVKGGNLKIERPFGEAPRIELIRNNSSKNFGGDIYQDWAIQNSGGTFELISGHSTNGNITVLTSDGTNVGIGTTSPGAKLDIQGITGTSESMVDDILRLSITTVYQDSMHGIGWYNTNESYLMGAIRMRVGPGYDYPAMTFWTSVNEGTPTEKMRIKHDGNVGIGIDNPNTRLQVNSTSDCYLKISAPHASQKALSFYDTTNSIQRWVMYVPNSSDDLRLYNLSGDKITFKNNGFVGIGTTSPHQLLTVTASSGTNYEGIALNSNSGYRRMNLASSGSGGNGNTYFNMWGSDNTTLATASGGPSSKVQIHCGGNTWFNGGNVGIGTDSPDAKLEIYKTVASGKTNTTPTNPSCLIYGDHEGEILWIGHPNQTQGLQLGYNTIKKWSTDGGATNDSFYFNISGSNDMVIDKDGNVGIGTTTLASVASSAGNIKLDVHENGTTGWRGTGVFGNQNQKVIIGVYDNKATIGGHNQALNAWSDLILGHGNCGIGTNSPNYKLDVYGSSSQRLARFQTPGDVSIMIESTSPSSDYDDCGLVWHGHASAPYWHLGVTDDEQWLCVGYQSNSTGSYGWGNSSESISFHYDGRIWYGGSWKGSDDRIKNNEKVVTNALDIINKLQTKRYFKSNKMYSAEHNYILNDDGIPIKDESGNDVTEKDYYIETGFIAQEVRKIPELAYCVTGEEMKYGKEYEIIYDENGNTIDDGTGHPKRKKVLGYHPKRLGLTYQDIFCYNVTATQELYKENIELKTKVATLESELAAIKQHLGI